MPRKTPKRRRSVAFPDQDEAQDIPAVEDAQPSGGPDEPIDITENANEPEPPAEGEGEPAGGPPALSEKELEIWETFREEHYEGTYCACYTSCTILIFNIVYLVLEQLPLSLHREFALISELDQQVSGMFLRRCPCMG